MSWLQGEAIECFLCRVEAICVLNDKKVFEDKSYSRVSTSHSCLVRTVDHPLCLIERRPSLRHLHGPCHHYHLHPPEAAGMDLHLLQGDQVRGCG